ncbi:hypothetical protein VTN96DRAFT_4608 [Rasamsonia emersonii]
MHHASGLSQVNNTRSSSKAHQMTLMSRQSNGSKRCDACWLISLVIELVIFELTASCLRIDCSIYPIVPTQSSCINRFPLSRISVAVDAAEWRHDHV